MNIKNKLKLILVLVLILLSVSATALADNWYESEQGYFTITKDDGEVLFLIGSQVYVGDEYISGDNQRYKIVEVDKSNFRARAEFVEDVGPVNIEYNGLYRIMQIVKKEAGNKVGLFCTHTDESYVPTDGTESEPEEGGILDVSKALEDALKERGCEVVRKDTPHEPHDAGAYRRSRQTAVGIIEELQPTILCDIHRDAVPPEVYEEEIDGQEVSKVRMVIGASNQNKAANEEFARELKEIADDKYPGLIKDIYIGKGSYNQDLMPQCILFEMGTHTIEKELPVESTKMLADVLATQMGIEAPKEGGDKKDDKGAKDNTKEQPKDNNQQEPKVEQTKNQWSDDKGAWKSVLTILAVAAVIGIIVLFFYNSKGERGDKFKGFWHELTGIGKRKK